tara:strand:+ start:13315 stop:15063 length:1749 start_codon:yes stop_codon:yes gene_type:complete
MLVNSLYSLWVKLPKTLKNRFYVCLVISVFASIFEIATLASLIPFVTVFLRPEAINMLSIFGENFTNIYFLNSDNISLVLLAFFFIFILASTITRIYLLKLQTSSAMNVGTFLSLDILERFMYMRYEVFSSISHSEIISLVYQKTYLVVHKTVLPCILIVSNCIIVGLVGSVVLAIEPLMTAMILLVICFFYIFISSSIRQKLINYSETLDNNYEALMKILNSALGNYREAKLYQEEKRYLSTYKKMDVALRDAETKVSVISGVPRYALEALLMFFLIAATVVMKNAGYDTGGIISSIAIVAIAGQRLAPLAQGIYANYTFLKANQKILKSITSNFDQFSRVENEIFHGTSSKQGEEKFQTIEFRDVSFKYQGDTVNVLTNINFKLNAGEFVGITGPSGSGKSTLLDVLLTFLDLDSGIILFNGKKLDVETKFNWMNNISLVSQDVFIDFESVKKNITGVDERLSPHEEQKLESVLNLTCLKDQIGKFEHGLETSVGERGSKISGGQRQRIALAKALYRGRPVVILDEATSALDEQMQTEVLKNLKSLEDRPTILLVTHRLNSLEHCDRIYSMNNGHLEIEK